MSSVLLAVDDSNTMRQMVSHVLREGGYQVLEAADAEAALELARGRVVDAVLTDHHTINPARLHRVPKRSVRTPENTYMIV